MQVYNQQRILDTCRVKLLYKDHPSDQQIVILMQVQQQGKVYLEDL